MAKLTKAEIIAALRDVAENGGHMEAPGTNAQITARWAALKDARFVRLVGRRYVLTPAGRAALEPRDER
jgi:hypothetical protein